MIASLSSPPLANIEAMRPVFLIVMGLALLLVAWRLTRHATGWPARVLMSGALLLALGYSVILPLYYAGVLVPLEHLVLHPHAAVDTMLAWHVVKLLAMNGGWLLFGLGLALQVGLFPSLASRLERKEAPALSGAAHREAPAPHGV